MSELNSEILNQMLQKAIAQTKAGVLKWESGPEEEEYKVDFARSSILVWKQEGNHGFVVRNANGAVVGILSTNIEPPSVDPKQIELLYNLIESKSLLLEETIDDVLKGLEGKSQPERLPF